MKKRILMLILSTFFISQNTQAQAWIDREAWPWLSLVKYEIFEDNGKEGVKERGTGKTIIPAVYTRVNSYDFLFKLFKVQKGEFYGIVNDSGKEILPPKYRKIGEFHDGEVAMVEGDEGLGFIDIQGNFVAPCQYESVSNFINEDGLVFVKKKGELWKVISIKNGQDVIPPKYESSTAFIEKRAFVKIGNLWGVINTKGEEIVPPQYEIQSEYSESMAFIKKNGLYGFIDLNGKEVITPQYQNVRSFNEGLAPVCMKGKWGFINKANQMIIPCEYDNFGDGGFREGNVVVWKKKKVGRVDKTGKVLIPPIYDVVYNFHDGLAAVISKDKLGYVDSTGVEIIPCIYDAPDITTEKFEDIDEDHKFFGNVAFVGLKGNYFLIDKSGYRINNEEYENIFGRRNLYLHAYKKEGGAVYLAINGKEFPEKTPNAKLEAGLSSWQDITSRVNDFEAETQFYIGKTYYEGNKEYCIEEDLNRASVWLKAAQQKGFKGFEYLGHGDYLYDIAYMLSKCRYEINEDEQPKELPAIEWLSSTNDVTGDRYQLKVGVKSKTQIKEVQVQVNGVRFRGISTVINDNYNHIVNKALTLSEGANEIKVKVSNSVGEDSLCKTVIYKLQKRQSNVRHTDPYIANKDSKKRVALVIGNKDYKHLNILGNPVNDADAVRKQLNDMGYDVLPIQNATKDEIEQRLCEFENMAVNSDVALFYYAGHGVSTQNGANYMIPIDCGNLNNDQDIESQCVQMSYVLRHLRDAKCKIKLMLLDNCREKVERNYPVQINYQSANIFNGKSSNEFVIYATCNESVASDGDNQHSPFAEAVLSAWKTPKIGIYPFSIYVNKQVSEKTSDAQNSMFVGSLISDFHF